MGAVLMLLAELGFIDIFIGGGTFAELDIGAAPYHYSDVPEWGAMLSNVRLGARSWPWTVVYPSLAFALAILAFNLFGEGLRRMIDRVGVGFTRVVNRTTVAGALVFILGIQWAGRYVGPSIYYREYAQAFDGQRALAHVETLTDPTLEGRAPGSVGQSVSAEYIAEQFRALGLQAAGQASTYFQTKPYNFTLLNEEPRLVVHDGGPQPIYRQDFSEYTGEYRGLGEATGTIRWVGLGRLRDRATFFGNAYSALDELDTAQDVLLLLTDAQWPFLVTRQPRQGALIVTGDRDRLEQREVMGSFSPIYSMYGTNRSAGYETPVFWISEELADRILAGTGQTVGTLREAQATLKLDEAAWLPTTVDVSVEITGTTHEKVPVRHVIGHLPGTRGRIEGGGAETQMDDQLIMVIAQYDGVGDDRTSAYPGANDNASGVGVMLEAIRTLQEQDYVPYRTFLFVAYAGEGQPHGLAYGRPIEPMTYLQAKAHFAGAYTLQSVVYLRGLGYGSEPVLEISARGSQRLLHLFEEAARRVGVRTQRAADRLNIDVVFDEGDAFDSADEAPNITLSRVGWEETSMRPSDTLDLISAQSLEEAGEALTLALMVMGREEY
jgi:hypothetical protein